MNPTQFVSASGLRPASAFVVIAGVLGLVAVFVARTALGAEVDERDTTQVERDPQPAYTVIDREARPMALFVQRLDLVMSPNAMWQAHTPEKIAAAISSLLEGAVAPVELLERMLPDAQGSVIRANVALDSMQAGRLAQWIETCGAPEGASTESIHGMAIAVGREGYELHWNPAVVLGETERGRHSEKFAKYPLRWGRFIADGIAQCLLPEALKIGDDELRLEAQRAEIWKILMPTNWCVAVRGFDASKAPALLELLSAEHVASHQMRIERSRDRRYPAGQFEFLGGWNYIDRSEGQRRALLAVGHAPADVATADQRAALLAAYTPEIRSELARSAWTLLREPLPEAGLERACDTLLGDKANWGFIDEARRQATYVFRRDHSVRGKLSRSYFLDSQESSEPTRVATTFDVMLQRQVGLALDDVMKEHRPAIAMAIVVELATGEVLAVDSRTAYEVSGFAPLFHEFTPGSTFKVPVMACALEQGAVTPETSFDVGNRSFRLGSRTIHEAESSKTGRLSASECLAYSVNAGLAQIGVRVPDDYMRGKFVELGYAQAPHSGLGGERDGYLPNTPWSHDWTHASISFGHELKVTLWQHVAGLATVVRGGEYLPLRVLDGVEQSGERYQLARADARRVFSRETSEKVRDMMQLGAQAGTGAAVASPDKLPGLVVGTKTGTAQKVPGEVCIHLELADQAAHSRNRSRCSEACRARLKSAARDHRVCYTSSMCIWGRVAGSEREIMTLVVVDEARGSQKYGSRVAGPTAVRILKEALSKTRNGAPVEAEIERSFAPSHEKSMRGLGQPWAEGKW